MARSLALDEMSTDEKLRLLEAIWEDLSSTPEEIPAPPWHCDVLRARELRLGEGKARLVDWPNAKAHIRDGLK